MTAIFRRDSGTGRAWLEFDGKPDDTVIATLKAAGWRWSGYRKQWHTNRRYATPPEGIAWTDGGACDYSEERADRLEARADAMRLESADLLAKADSIMDRIPMGQPVPVGHHSERRHRRDLARIDRALSEGFAAQNYATELDRRAEAVQVLNQQLWPSRLRPGLDLPALQT